MQGTTVMYSTLVKAVVMCMFLLFFSVAVPSFFSIEIINSTAVRAMWSEVESPYLHHYTIYYYYMNPAQSGSRKKFMNEKMVRFPAGTSFGVVGALDEEKAYLFSLAVTFNINDTIFEGRKTEAIAPSGYVCYYIRRDGRVKVQ